MSKVISIYVKFTKTTHQIWSCQMTLASNSENFYFSSNSLLNFRKGYQIWGKLAQKQKSYRPNQIGGWKTPPRQCLEGYRISKILTLNFAIHSFSYCLFKNFCFRLTKNLCPGKLNLSYGLKDFSAELRWHASEKMSDFCCVYTSCKHLYLYVKDF